MFAMQLEDISLSHLLINAPQSVEMVLPLQEWKHVMMATIMMEMDAQALAFSNRSLTAQLLPI